MAARIFVSYRRRDTSGYAHLVYTVLRKEFGADNVFMDVDTIQPGQDFVDTLDRALSTCDVIIVLIGPTWLSIQDENGVRRLDDPNDFVRLEITSAINHKKKLIPVLFDGAAMPAQDELPSDLRVLSRRQAVRIGEHAADDIERLLMRSIKQAMQEQQQAHVTTVNRQKKADGGSSPLRKPVVLFSFVIGALCLSTIALAAIYWSGIIGGPDQPPPTQEITSEPQPPPDSPPLTADVPDDAPQWRIDGDRAVIQWGQQYWEKYEADTNPSGLYLRSDSIDSFGDFLELNADGTFTLQQSGTVQTGTWTLNGDLISLVY